MNRCISTVPYYLVPAAGDTDGKFVGKFSGWFFKVPPLDFQGIRGGSAGSESTRHLNIIALPNSHIFGNFSKGSWEGKTELQGLVNGRD